MPHLIALLLMTVPAQAGGLLPPDATRDAYVDDALAGNLALRARRVSVEESRQVIAAARAQLLPTLTFEARASERAGAVLDLGQLVNPAYAGLNQILGRQAYPTNLEVALPLKRETKVSALLPVFAPALWHQQALRRDESAVERARTAAFARQLRADVQAAYYLYGRTAAVIRVLDRTTELLQESLRTATLLVRTGKATEDAVHRARADLGEVEQRRAAATRGLSAAARYLNFLANRDLEQPVPAPVGLETPPPLPRAPAELEKGVDQREELAALAAGSRAAASAVRLTRSAYLPTLALAAEYGFQGDRYDFSSDRDYFVGSVVVRWNLWNGFGDRARTRQASLAAERIDLETQQVRRQLVMQLRQVWDEAATARQAITTAEARVTSSRAAFAIVSARFAAGSAPSIELLEARTALERAEVDQVIATYDFAARLVELERVAALAPEVKS